MQNSWSSLAVTFVLNQHTVHTLASIYNVYSIIHFCIIMKYNYKYKYSRNEDKETAFL